MNKNMNEPRAVLVGIVLGLVGMIVRAVLSITAGAASVYRMLCMFGAGAAVVLGSLTKLLDHQAKVGAVFHVAGVLLLGAVVMYLVQHFLVGAAGRSRHHQ